jgi:hypothetical protein
MIYLASMVLHELVHLAVGDAAAHHTDNPHELMYGRMLLLTACSGPASNPRTLEPATIPFTEVARPYEPPRRRPATPTCATPPSVLDVRMALPLAPEAAAMALPPCTPGDAPGDSIIGIASTEGFPGYGATADNRPPSALVLLHTTDGNRLERWWTWRDGPERERLETRFEVTELVDSAMGGVALGVGIRQVVDGHANSGLGSLDVCEPGEVSLALRSGCLTTHERNPQLGTDAELTDSVFWPGTHWRYGYIHPRSAAESAFQIGGDTAPDQTALIAQTLDDMHDHLVTYDADDRPLWDIVLPVEFEDGPYFQKYGRIFINASHPSWFDQDGCAIDVRGWPSGRAVPLVLGDGVVVLERNTARLIAPDGTGIWSLQFADDVVINAATANWLGGARAGRPWLVHVDPSGNLLCNPG